jgi:hypothetical protein
MLLDVGEGVGSGECLIPHLLDAALVRLNRINIGDADRTEQLAIKDFAHRVSDILSWVAATLMPRGSDLHTKGIDAAIDLILQRTRPSGIERHTSDLGSDRSR